MFEYCYRKFRSLRKSFRGRIKKQLLEKWVFKYDGVMDSPEEDLWPAPIKLLNAILDSIRVLKVNIFFITSSICDCLILYSRSSAFLK